jgi:IMP dehydrogenase
MREYSNKEHLSFDDILLIPQHSEAKSRKDVSLKTFIGKGHTKINLDIPIIGAPMDTVCEWAMVESLGFHGAMGIFHRYMTIEEQASMVRSSRSMVGLTNIGSSVGAKGSFIQEAKVLAEMGANLVLVDVANGHNVNAADAVRTLRKELGYNIHIMAGNVSTWEGYARLAEAGADSVRVGIGGGSACTTRVVSGHGMPTLSSIMDIREKFDYAEGPSVIADGGIRNSGDAAKALAAGAHAVMLGRLLAGTSESPGDVVDGYKVFRGMASREAQEAGRGFVSGVEGISTRVPFVGSVTNIINDFRAGLSSALSYTGSDNLIDFYSDSMYNRVSSSSLNETKPHAKES